VTSGFLGSIPLIVHKLGGTRVILLGLVGSRQLRTKEQFILSKKLLLTLSQLYSENEHLFLLKS
jgi:hypothetical protein